jgi:hypothetical protein
LNTPVDSQVSGTCQTGLAHRHPCNDNRQCGSNNCRWDGDMDRCGEVTETTDSLELASGDGSGEIGSGESTSAN